MSTTETQHLIFQQTCSNLTIETLEKEKVWNMFKDNNKNWRRSGVFIVNFEHISHLFLCVSIIDFRLPC